jgi:hypothetical protein
MMLFHLATNLFDTKILSWDTKYSITNASCSELWVLIVKLVLVLFCFVGGFFCRAINELIRWLSKANNRIRLPNSSNVDNNFFF